jgi:hypothetical protein
MKHAILAILGLVAGLQAATRVTGPVTYASGAKANGALVVEWPAFVAAGRSYQAGSVRTNVRNGEFLLQLEANDASQPDFLYRVVIQFDDGSTRVEAWRVPTTTATVTAASVRVQQGGAAPVGNMPIPLAQLSTTGASIGDCARVGAAGWAPGPCNQGPPVSYTTTVAAASYASGQVAAQTGSTTITGTGTAWTAAMSGRWFLARTCGFAYRFTWVSATQGTLSAPFGCGSQDADDYALVESSRIPATAHGLGAGDLEVQCYGPSSDAQFAERVDPAKVVEQPETGNIEVVWYGAFQGRCVVRR